MELKFLGRGAALNPKEGSNSAYFIDNNDLFLIDCGETVFAKLMEKNLLNSVNNIYLMITHTHSDHTGSIGSLGSYITHILHKELNIIIKRDVEYLDDLNNLIKAFGIKATFAYEEDFDGKYSLFNKIRFHKTVHGKTLSAYSIFFVTKEGIVYFSGDTAELDTLKSLLKSNYTIDKIYFDVTSIPYIIHVYLDDLKNAVPSAMRKKIYCMHFDDDKCISKALEYGFNIVEVD